MRIREVGLRAAGVCVDGWLISGRPTRAVQADATLSRRCGTCRGEEHQTATLGGETGLGGGGQEGGDARRFPVAEFWPRRVDGCSWFVRLTTHHLLAALRSCFSAEFRFPLAPPTGDASSTNKSAVVRNISNTNPRRHPFSTRVETPLREQHSSSPRNTQRRKKKKQTPHTSLGSNARGSL